MRETIRKILREETSSKLLDAILDPNNTNPKVVKARKRLIDDEGYIDLSMIKRIGLFDGSSGDFGKMYPELLHKYTDSSNGTGWYKGNKVHRVGKTAFIEDGYVEWFDNDLQHRLEGPAIYTQNEDGSVDYQNDVQWWVDGDEVANYTMEDGVDVSDQEVWDEYFKDDYERGY